MRYRLLVVLLSMTVSCTFGLNILVMFPFPGKSHFNSYVGLFKALANKGHNLTVISHFPLRNKIPNYRDIEIGGIESFFDTKLYKMVNISNFDANSRLPKYSIFLLIAEAGKITCEVAYKSRAVQSFLKEENHFDLAITEYFNTDCFLTLIKQFNLPVIRVSSCTLMPWSSERYGNPNNPTYIPNNFLQYSDKMSFFERLENTMLTVFQSFYFNSVALSSDRSVSMEYFGDVGASLNSDVLNDSLLLTASHYSLNLPRPLVPTVVEVGGLHIGNPEILPKVGEKIL